MSLKYIPCVLFLMLLALAPISNASVPMTTTTILNNTMTPVVVLATTESTIQQTTLAQDNSHILATSGMSTMFAIWNMSPPQYCASKLLFNSRHNRLPCKLKAL